MPANVKRVVRFGLLALGLLAGGILWAGNYLGPHDCEFCRRIAAIRAEEAAKRAQEDKKLQGRWTLAEQPRPVEPVGDDPVSGGQVPFKVRFENRKCYLTELVCGIPVHFAHYQVEATEKGYALRLTWHEEESRVRQATPEYLATVWQFSFDGDVLVVSYPGKNGVTTQRLVREKE